jgi:putative ABC transport system permease protein
MNWFVFAARNLLRNQRRSAVTILAAAFGFTAVNIFGGFTAYMFDNLRDAFIYAGGNGHLQIYRTGYKENATTDPGKYLVPGELYQRLGQLPEKDKRILLIAGTMELTGQLDSGDRAGQGVPPLPPRYLLPGIDHPGPGGLVSGQGNRALRRQPE